MSTWDIVIKSALRLSCGCLAAVLWLPCGCLAAALWLSCGCLAAVLWLPCGCLAAVLRLSCGCLAAVLWLSCGCLVAVLWLSCGCLVAALRLSCGCLAAQKVVRISQQKWTCRESGLKRHNCRTASRFRKRVLQQAYETEQFFFQNSVHTKTAYGGRISDVI